jgi:hypothetical protein
MAPEYKHPRAVEDLATAENWVVSHAKNLHEDSTPRPDSTNTYQGSKWISEAVLIGQHF